MVGEVSQDGTGRGWRQGSAHYHPLLRSIPCFLKPYMTPNRLMTVAHYPEADGSSAYVPEHVTILCSTTLNLTVDERMRRASNWENPTQPLRLKPHHQGPAGIMAWMRAICGPQKPRHDDPLAEV